MIKLHATAFEHENQLLEDYLAGFPVPLWGALTGKGMKGHQKAAARAAADSFERTAKQQRHRDVFRSQLEGAAVNPQVASVIAYHE